MSFFYDTSIGLTDLKVRNKEIWNANLYTLFTKWNMANNVERYVSVRLINFKLLLFIVWQWGYAAHCFRCTGGLNRSTLTEPGGELGSGYTSSVKKQSGATFGNNTVILSLHVYPSSSLHVDHLQILHWHLHNTSTNTSVIKYFLLFDLYVLTLFLIQNLHTFVKTVSAGGRHRLAFSANSLDSLFYCYLLIWWIC